MSNPTTPFSWQMPTATDLVTDLPADFEVFGQAVATSMADLLGGTTGQILSKTSNTDMDFTWINNDQGDITGVTAGTGISGGGTSGTVTVTNSMATAIDAKGDLIGGTGADAFARLAVGTNGQVLTADSTAATGLAWATAASGTTLVGCSVRRSADLTVSNGTFTTVTYDLENYDTDAFHSTSTNTSRMTIPAGKAGKYQIQTNITFNTSGAGERYVSLLKNGVEAFRQYGATPTSAGAYTVSLFTIEDLAVSDYVEIRVYQSSGGNLTALFNGYGTYFTINYIGA